jgi:hypothetical protein
MMTKAYKCLMILGAYGSRQLRARNGISPTSRACHMPIVGVGPDAAAAMAGSEAGEGLFKSAGAGRTGPCACLTVTAKITI